MGHARVTSDTIVDQDNQIGKVLDGSADVVANADNLLAGVREVLVPLVERLERLTRLAADERPSGSADPLPVRPDHQQWRGRS